MPVKNRHLVSRRKKLTGGSIVKQKIFVHKCFHLTVSFTKLFIYIITLSCVISKSFARQRLKINSAVRFGTCGILCYGVDAPRQIKQAQTAEGGRKLSAGEPRHWSVHKNRGSPQGEPHRILCKGLQLVTPLFYPQSNAFISSESLKSR